MAEISPQPEQLNPYETFNTPTALVGHLANTDPSSVDWKAVAERAAGMEGQDGAGSLAVLALDRHLRASEQLKPAINPSEINTLSSVTEMFSGSVSRGEVVVDELNATTTRLSRTLEEGVQSLDSRVSRIEDALHPEIISRLARVADTLGEVLAPHRVQQLDEASYRISGAAAQMNQGRW